MLSSTTKRNLITMTGKSHPAWSPRRRFWRLAMPPCLTVVSPSCQESDTILLGIPTNIKAWTPCIILHWQCWQDNTSMPSSSWTLHIDRSTSTMSMNSQALNQRFGTIIMRQQDFSNWGQNDIQFIPPNNHHRNMTEKAIQSSVVVHPQCPWHLWCLCYHTRWDYC